MEDKDMVMAASTIVASMIGRYQQGLPDKLEKNLCEKAYRMVVMLTEIAKKEPRV